MIHPLRFIIAVALVSITSTSLAQGTGAASTTTSSPASIPSGIEVDVIYPIRNATYNANESLPIVFALQNLTVAAALGTFTFTWGIIPAANVGENLSPGIAFNNYQSTTLGPHNTTTDPYILVRQTDAQTWNFNPTFGPGPVYVLQWIIEWYDAPIRPCNSYSLGVFGALYFTIIDNGPEPDLGSLIGQCPQLGGVYEVHTTAKNSSCTAEVIDGRTGNPCAITLDKALIQSISNTEQTARSTSASASAAPSQSAHNAAVGSYVPLPYIFVAIFFMSL